VFIVERLQVATHLQNSNVWILEQAIVICDSQAIVAIGPMASSLQWLVIFGYKFTSFLLGLQPW
jgi:hypothetical protein